jgi:hypothetical protein
MTGSEEHLAHYVPHEGDEEVRDKLEKLSDFTEKADFVKDRKSGIEECAADPDELGDRAQALLKALGFDRKVTMPFARSV